MKPETRTVNELFELGVRYVVPLYQRPYVWKLDDQWEPLWEDILVLLRDEGAIAGVQFHFLGAIVLDQETRAPGRLPQYTVIDGQQRLTTLQLVISASERALAELGHENESAILGDLVRNDPKRAKGDDVLKVWPTNINRRAFKAVMNPSIVDAPDDDRNLIQEAHVYFRDRVRDWITDDLEGGDPAKRSERLRIVLMDLLKVVAITLEPGDNAQVIFETLNARGTDLLALDLVKNAVFQEATRQYPSVDALYDEVWKPQLDDDFWRGERRQGRLNRAKGELFLTYWLGMKLGKIIPATERFSTFRKHILNQHPPADAASLVRELTSDARTLRSFDAQPAGSAEALFFERLEALDVTTVMPLALLLFTRQEVDVVNRRNALQMLESWLVRRTLLRMTTKNYSREIADLLERVGKEPHRAAAVVFDQLSASTADANRWPSDAAVIEYLTTHDAYSNIAGPRLVMVLRAIERSLAGSNPDVVLLNSKLTLEHVMPQEWRTNWHLGEVIDEADAARRASERDRRIHMLGNLTLVTPEVNSGMSNSAWAEKQMYLEDKTRLLLNIRLRVEFGQAFDEGAIDRRTVRLASDICTIWPGPDARWAGVNSGAS